MRFFASWWERFPFRAVAPVVLLAIVGIVGGGYDGGWGDWIWRFFGPDSFQWG